MIQVSQAQLAGQKLTSKQVDKVSIHDFYNKVVNRTATLCILFEINLVNLSTEALST